MSERRWNGANRSGIDEDAPRMDPPALSERNVTLYVALSWPFPRPFLLLALSTSS